MHTLKPAFLALCFALISGGCATMTAEDCTGADWHAIGMTDGSQGQTLSKADRRASDCARHDVAMDRSAYDAGRHQGLAQYCVESTAYRLGELGQGYNGVCVDHGEVDFLVAYEKGRELHTFTSAARGASDQLASAEQRHEALDERLDKYWGGYRDEGLTMEEHNTMVLELWSERKYLETTAIPYWREAEVALSRALTRYREKVAANDPSIGTRLRPPAYSGPEPWDGPTEADARAMLQEVFSTLASSANGSD